MAPNKKKYRGKGLSPQRNQNKQPVVTLRTEIKHGDREEVALLGEELYEHFNLLRYFESEEAFVGSPHWQSEKIARIHYSRRFMIYTVFATSCLYFVAFSREVCIFSLIDFIVCKN